MYVRRRPVGVNGATLVECPRRCVEAGRFRMDGGDAAFGEPPEPVADEFPGKAFAARGGPGSHRFEVAGAGDHIGPADAAGEEAARAGVFDNEVEGLVVWARGPQRLVVLKRPRTPDPRVSTDGDPFSKERIRGVTKAVWRGQLRRR